MSNAITEIKQTLAAYCHRVDRGSAAEVAELFADDALLLPYYDGDYTVEGRDNIQAWYAFYHDHLRAGVRHLKHLIHSISLEIDGTVANGVCYLTAHFISKEDGVAYQAQGTYFDQYVRVNSSWLFQRRQIEVEFVTAHGVPIEQMTPMGFPGAKK